MAKKKVLVTVVAVGLALGLAACGGKKDDNKTATAGTSAFNAANGSVVNASDVKGGTLKLANSSDADSWDPTRAYYGWVWDMQRLYTRTLMANDAKPGKDGLELVPDLASKAPEISADGLTYTFTLKDGVKFEDGTAITSKDIKYGIERVFAQDVLSGGPTYLIDFLDQGQGYKGPFKDTDPNKLGLKSVETPDDKTIVFHLKEKFGDFPYLLAMGAASPVPMKSDTGDKYGSKPVSSGPYKFEKYEPGKSVTFVRNEAWDRGTDTIRKALPDRIELALGLDPVEIDNRLLNGTIDLDTGGTGVQSAAQIKITQDPKLKAYADAPVTGAIRYVAISNNVAPFDNEHCRKAVQYAIDKTGMQTARGGAIAGGDIAVNMLPPNIAGHDPAFDLYGTKSGAPQVEKAKEELKLCGKPEGFSTVIAVRNKGKDLKSVEPLQASLKAVGINASVEQHEASVYYKSVIGSPENVHKKGYGLMVSGWGADWPTGYGYLQILVDGRAILKNGNNNFAEMNSPEINSLIDQARSETDATKAAAIWSQINTKVMENGGLVPIVYDKALNYRNERLTNVYVHEAYNGIIDFVSLGVAK